MKIERFGLHVLVGLAVLAVLAGSPPGTAGTARAAEAGAQDTVHDRIVGLFGSLPESGEQNYLVLVDERDRVYLAFYLAGWMGEHELRAYSIPFDEVGELDRDLAGEDPRAAFTTLLDAMGPASRYISDVGLDGIRDEEVQVGTGRLRDYFSRNHFASHAEAHAAYEEWLERSLQLAGPAA